MIIILFGAPGVGKGTQAAIKNETEVGKVAKGYVEAGDLVPDDVVARIVDEAMNDASFANGAILDGFPRTQGQADVLATMLERRGWTVDKVVNIEVDDATITERLLARGRADDSKEIIENRLDVYRQETAPLLAYYLERGNLVSIDGVGEIDDVNQRILDVIS